MTMMKILLKKIGSKIEYTYIYIRYFFSNSICRQVLATRTYDLFIGYDKYYWTPRLWLMGYTENGMPLTSNQIMEDVNADYADKTVTWEKFPNFDVNLIKCLFCEHRD